MKQEQEIFGQALALPAGEAREAYLMEVCGQDRELRRSVDELLAAFNDAGAIDFLKGGDRGHEGRIVLVGARPEDGAGTVIGRYKLLEKIGEGGMGVVYMAEQEVPVHRRVALKIIKLGMDTHSVVARFEGERQALAMMDHPNIAKVLDGGATDTGRPYFVMELVHGVKITEYCDEAKHSTGERLQLFIKVCQAVQHAHQKGIIHRDIKPSNILVTLHDGVPVPKVIDFGIAKAAEGRLTDQTLFTAFEQFLGTPVYMSPEQAEMSGLDIDTRSDIYSLGVLLYELLTGKTPFDARELLAVGLDAMRRTILEQEPVRPSTRLRTMLAADLSMAAKHRQTEPPRLVHLVHGDLDWIVMKCLEKDRTRRYDTANGVVMDIQRHLGDEPVVARPPSSIYRLQKAWRRCQAALAAAALIAAVLVAATGISAWEAVRATRAETLANKRLAESEVISRFLTEVFQSPDPARDGRSITVAETLGAAANKLETDLASQPARRAKLQATLGATHHALGLYREAIPLQEKVRDYYLAVFGPEDTNTLQAMHNLARSYFEDGRRDEPARRIQALKLGEQVLALRRKVSGSEDPDTLNAMNDLALYYDDADRRDEALKLRKEVLAFRRKLLGPENPETVRAMHNLANSYEGADRENEQLKLREQVLALSRKVNGSAHSDTLRAMCNLAYSYEGARRVDEALKLREQELALQAKVNGPQHPDTLNAMNNLADSYFSLRRNQEAIALAQQACEFNPKSMFQSLRLATFQAWFGQDAEYEATRCHLVQQAEGTDQHWTAEQAVKAYCLRPSTDRVLLTKVLNLAHRALELGKGDRWSQLALGLAEYRNGQYASAELTLSVVEQIAGREDELKETARLFRGMSLFRQAKPEEAQKLLSQAEAQMDPFPTDYRPPLIYGRFVTTPNVLILWVAYKEAKRLIQGPPVPIDEPSAPK